MPKYKNPATKVTCLSFERENRADISLNIHTPLIVFCLNPLLDPLPLEFKSGDHSSSLQLDWCQSVHSLVELECLKEFFFCNTIWGVAFSDMVDSISSGPYGWVTQAGIMLLW